MQTAERQMQELLFGTSSSAGGQQPTAAHSSSSSSAYSLQKPKPVRPSATSAFSVYSSTGARHTTEYRFRYKELLCWRFFFIIGIPPPSLNAPVAPRAHGPSHAAQLLTTLT